MASSSGSGEGGGGVSGEESWSVGRSKREWLGSVLVAA